LASAGIYAGVRRLRAIQVNTMELAMLGLGRMGAESAASLFERLRSRDTDSISDKLLAAMRNQFGGHAIKEG
jgi:6-phosphogluconate dehydrogenase (decarboxylating)